MAASIIPSLDASASLVDMADALNLHGCLVINNFADEEARTPLMSQLDEVLAKTEAAKELGKKVFLPGNTKRVPGLIAKVPACHDFVTDPRLLALCDATLLPNCPGVDFSIPSIPGPEDEPSWKTGRYQLHAGPSALVIGPGARKQFLHREEDPFTFFPIPRPNLITATMLALSDFTKENGATLLVPGSHKWPKERRARAEEILPGVMPAGSLLVWLGGTLHAGGPNTTADNWRKGMITTFSAGWLRQEENQYINTPIAVAKTLSPKLRALCGYQTHNIGLGMTEFQNGFTEFTLESSTVPASKL